jgi:hypothetical protein
MQMEYRQRKMLQTDRVVLVPGPKAETDTVRRVFNAYAVEKKSLTVIASELNAGGITTTRGMNWTSAAIHIMLTNEAYLGSIVYNRKSFKLQRALIKNPPEMWIRHDTAVAPIVCPAMFHRAQKLRAQRNEKITDREALNRLAALWRRAGDLSKIIIEKAEGVPSPTTYTTRFGSLANAYRLIGFEPRLRIAQGKNKVRSVMEAAIASLSANGVAAYDDQARVLMTKTGLAVSLLIAWNYKYSDRSELRWYLRGNAYASPRFNVRSALTLAIRMKFGNEEVDDYYLIPTARLAVSGDRHFRFSRRLFDESFRYSSIELLCTVLASAK